MDDIEIVGLYWRRDENAIACTDKKYRHYLNTIAFNILCDREDSQESVNDTYLAAWNSIPPHKPQVLSTYLGKLTRRISIDMFRKKNAEKRAGGEYALSLDELADCFSAGNTTEQAADLQLLSQAIAAYLKTLPQETQNVFLGRYYYLDPVAKIAGYCRISQSKVKILLYRTRQGLGQHLKEEGFL